MKYLSFMILILACASKIYAAKIEYITVAAYFETKPAVRFAAFPQNQPNYNGKNHTLNMNTPFSKRFRTILRNTLQDKKAEANGKYIQFGIPCGSTGCTDFGLLNAKTGEAIYANQVILGCSDELPGNIVVRKHSSLLIAVGCMYDYADGRYGYHHFKIQPNGKLMHIKSYIVK